MPKTRTSAGPRSDKLLLQAARFSALFKGNDRSSGRFDPATEKMFTEYKGLQQKDWEEHLDGNMGAGVVPIMDDDTCMWAAIDIDNHDSDEDLPLAEVAERIAVKKLPLVACRSKSGGIHCYLFLEKAQSCARVRIMMAGWAQMIGYPGVEIFPKQGKLVPGTDGKLSLGNWINLPYLSADATMRYAYLDGDGRLTLDEFFDLAEKQRMTPAGLRALSSIEHPEAPPCIQKMYAQGVLAGQRNEALYNIVVYHKKANPDAFESKAKEANQAVFSKPLPRAELGRTIASASRADCAYRCNEEPIRSLCDREACITRKFGITSGDLERLNTTDALPIFSGLVKYVTEPVRWEFKIDTHNITNVPTEVLLDWRALRLIIAERLTRVVPLIKNSEWERILQPLMKEARIIDAPDDASITGAIRNRVREFASKCDLLQKGEDKADRKALLRGMPIVQVVDGDRQVVFRSEDLINYLKRTKSEELKGVNLWFAVKAIGVTNHRMRIPDVKGDPNINVWCLPVKEVLQKHEHEAEAPTFKSDL